MIPMIPWFERTFALDLPLGMYAIVVERLRGAPARLEDRLRSIPPASLARRDGERWSIQEHAGHLLDLEPLGMRRLDEFEEGRATLSAADRENRATFDADHNAAPAARILLAFRRERAAMVARLERYDEGFVRRTAIHPRLGVPMRVLDFAYFVAEHDDHHLARITETARALGG